MKKRIALCAGLLVAASVSFLPALVLGGEGRTVVSLDGTWQISESVGADEMPTAFAHTVPVPGLADQSAPAFSDVGVPQQKRNYFWYRTTFTPSERREVALLRIAKSQFGTTVWLNGKKVGENLSCWTAGLYNLTDAMRWQGENQLLVRIGADRRVLPKSLPGGGANPVKRKWIPGIYDSVSLILCDNPVIDTIQVAPRLKTSEVTVQTKIKNYGAAREFELRHRIKGWKDGREAAQSEPQRGRLEAGEEKTLTHSIPLPNARLWSPEDPFLYVAETSTGGDKTQTRFGMREVRFDSTTTRAYLNGKEFYMRGGDIELSIYMDDHQRGNRPWDKAWVRKLLVEVPRRLNWNTFRFQYSAMPEAWLDMCDEEGMLVQYEPVIWGYSKDWEPKELIKEFGRWMRDNWNHPCVFMWDASNETLWLELVKTINAVRGLDLSNRAWDNSYNAPAGPDDPVESHPYRWTSKGSYDFRSLNGFASRGDYGANLPGTPGGKGHCYIINEYDWVWLHLDGVPVAITKEIYQKALPASTPEERTEFRWYVTASLTEMWRTWRGATAVIYYTYLGGTGRGRTPPAPYHAGPFADVSSLQLQPAFEKYMIDAFKPLGVCLDFWGDGKPSDRIFQQWGPIRGGADHEFSIVTINDDDHPVNGKLVLSIETPEGRELARSERPLRLAGLGREVHKMSLPIPKENGKYLLKAAAYPEGTRHKGPTVSRRKVSVEPIATDGCPHGGWERLTHKEAAAAGWSREKLAQAQGYSATLDTAAVMIVTRGKVLDAWGETARKFKVHSIRKSFLSALYGIQVEAGRVKLDRTLAELGIDDNPPSLTDVEKSATVRQLLQARSGVYHPALYETAWMKSIRPSRRSHAPGEFWSYNNWDFNALGTIYERAGRAGIYEDLGRYIAAPLGMEDYVPADGQYVTGEDSIHRAYPFRMTARDMARFGLLYLRSGRWNGKQIVPEAWIKESTRSYSDADSNEDGKTGYGYMWWVATNGQHLLNVKLPDGTFSARGADGHYILVVPAYDLVVVHRVDTDIEGRKVTGAQFGELVRRILLAYTPPAPAS